MQSTTSTTTLLNDISQGVLSLSFDVVIILSIAALFFLHALYRGKSKSLATFVALLFAALTTSFFPYSDALLGGGYFSDPLVMQATVFGVIFLIFRFSTKWMVFGDFPDRFTSSIAQALILSFFNTVLLLFFVYHIIPFGVRYAFSSPLHEFLSSEIYFFWTLIISVTGLFFLNRGTFF